MPINRNHFTNYGTKVNVLITPSKGHGLKLTKQLEQDVTIICDESFYEKLLINYGFITTNLLVL